jgi:hypothetical protein
MKCVIFIVPLSMAALALICLILCERISADCKEKMRKFWSKFVNSVNTWDT